MTVAGKLKGAKSLKWYKISCSMAFIHPTGGKFLCYSSCTRDEKVVYMQEKGMRMVIKKIGTLIISVQNKIQVNRLKQIKIRHTVYCTLSRVEWTKD